MTDGAGLVAVEEEQRHDRQQQLGEIAADVADDAEELGARSLRPVEEQAPDRGRIGAVAIERLLQRVAEPGYRAQESRQRRQIAGGVGAGCAHGRGGLVLQQQRQPGQRHDQDHDDDHGHERRGEYLAPATEAAYAPMRRPARVGEDRGPQDRHDERAHHRGAQQQQRAEQQREQRASRGGGGHGVVTLGHLRSPASRSCARPTVPTADRRILRGVRR
jgi:hypothetical protein